MLKLEDLYSLLEVNFDYLLVTGEDGAIIHVSPLLEEELPQQNETLVGKKLEEILTKSSAATFREAMAQARSGNRGVGGLSPQGGKDRSIPLKASYAEPERGPVFLFFGNRLHPLGSGSEWEKEERIKELSCLYQVAEWIEVSSSIREFFEKLPRYLAQGMLYPEEVVVYSQYQGIEYGQRPSTDRYLSTNLVVGGREAGEIRVGYLDDKHQLLHEEQRMLDEIGRTLSLALERKELRERMALREEEQREYDRQLRELKREIDQRETELREQQDKLGIVDSYLERVNRGWEEARTRLETVFQAVPDDVVLIDRNRKVVMTNREDIPTGSYCYRSIFDRESKCEDCRLVKIMKEKTPVTLTMKHGDRYLEVHALPVYNKDHEVDGILEFYRDVTLEKTYEQQIQQADKLASLGQLVSGIGHEINNPNQFIRGNIKILKQALEDIIPILDDWYAENPDLKIARLKYDFFRKHVMTLVDDMAHGSERIKSIVEGLRGFARKDEGLLVDCVDVNTLIESTTRLVHKEVHKRAEIELNLSSDLPTFTGNSQKIEQVLVNLIVNASQAIPDDRKGLIRVGTRQDGEDVVIEIADNGKGMSEKTRKQIFDPFFTTKRARGGTGLGLAIAYRIIEEHGGNIAVASKVGEGTTFTIRIPAVEACDTEEGAPA